MRFLFKLTKLLYLFPFCFQTLNACTAFQLTSQDNSLVYCRSMELGVDLRSNLLLVPRNTSYQGTAPNNKPGLNWKTKYGFVGVNQWLFPNVVSDGMNEKGLVVGMLLLPGFAEYEKEDPEKLDRTIGAWELGAFLLSNCATVEEATSLLDKILVVQQPIPSINFSLPLHYYIADSKGSVIVVEYVGGKKFIHDNPVKVLTNSPPFDWHIKNLSNYVNLSPLNIPDFTNSKKDLIKAIGEGSGLLGIPGDYTPPSRFVRASLYSAWATVAKNGDDAARLGFHILNTFDIFFGIIREKPSDIHVGFSKELLNHIIEANKGDPSININKTINTDFTQWIVVHDQTQLKTYFRDYFSLEIQAVDLKKLDFSKPGIKQNEVTRDFIVNDITDKFTPIKK
ncbi:linear amide C-N hydrolase [Criblamydia sequanensis]|uniref:Linear amide hydrolase n=1 Tax=Candidatus Criblamydia sequanensis CRIB-18 TaxID=1437425 RepID=A0A090D114_9BACT|nr:choloylglycine hydrolase family protein [Criblamydia sequanensis]CDR35242.1 Linear amide hydrolase [Criblamydia sequanensis CRIB-18]